MRKSNLPAWAQNARVVGEGRRRGNSRALQGIRREMLLQSGAEPVDIKRLQHEKALAASRSIEETVRFSAIVAKEVNKYKATWDRFLESWLQKVIDIYGCTLDDVSIVYKATGFLTDVDIMLYGQPLLRILSKEEPPGIFTFKAMVIDDDGTNDGGAVPPAPAA